MELVLLGRNRTIGLGGSIGNVVEVCLKCVRSKWKRLILKDLDFKWILRVDSDGQA